MGMAVSSYQTELPCRSDRCFPDLIGKCWFPPESCGRWEDMVSMSAVSPLKGCWETLEKRHCKSKTKSVRGALCESHLLCSPGCSSYSSTIRRSSSRWGKSAFSPICFLPQKGPPSLLKLLRSRVPEPRQHCWLQERAAFILAALAATWPP